MNVSSTGVEYTRNNPERFTERSTDHSWLRYLIRLYVTAAWADAIVLQAVADALNLTIHIIESNPGFASVTNMSPVSSETDTTVITIRHLDEAHYVSTVPFNEQAMAFNVIRNNQPAQLATGRCRTTNNNERNSCSQRTERESLFEVIHGNKEKK